MITVLHDADRREREAILASDPFQMAEPSWRRRILSLLPIETVSTVVRISPEEELKRMAIKMVAETQAPERSHKRGVISSTSDWNDVMSVLRSAPKTVKDAANKDIPPAFVISMTDQTWLKPEIKKPETVFANALRRYFESKGIMLTAYQSGKFEVTVRKATALDATAKRKK